MVFFAVALAVFVLDRLTKAIVNATVPYGTEVPLLGNLVGITNIRNAGAAFGFAPVGPWFFLVAALAVSVGLVVYVVRQPADLGVDAVLGLILGGAIGNAFDRIINGGGVTDFINFHFWPVFNVADSAVSIGVVLLIAGYFLRKPTAG
ncbi:MAG: signal peptidase II [Actinobacteria bacterium 13_1_20CM_2_65_11]|nr:MAG: signal peptidase II [Actinobacteria bacterium 13_1_20CM_2_65_11]